MLDDVSLVLTVAHELEHLRQEHRCRGLLEVGNIAITFVKQNAALFPDMPTDIHVPVNAHAERVAARVASRVVGEEQVQAYYASSRPDLLDIVDDSASSPEACTDLRDFFQRHWSEFQTWASVANRLYLDTVRRFLGDPCK